MTKGYRKATTFDFSQYQRTYNNAIDLCAQCIGYYRSIGMPVKTIFLNERYYGLFRKGVEVLMGRELLPEEQLQFDGVNIESRRAQFESIEVEFYSLKAEA